MLKGQRVAFVLIILLMLYSIKRNPSEWGTYQMCTNMNAQIHEGQQAGRKEGHLIGLYTSTFQRKNRYYLHQHGLRSSYWRQKDNLLGLPVSECCGHSWWQQWFGQVGAPWAGGHVGMGSARRSPQLLPHQPSSSWNSEPSWPQARGIVPDWGGRCHLGSASAACPMCRAALGAAAWSRLWFLLGTEQCCQLPAACYNCNACFGNAEPKPGWNLPMSRVSFGQLHPKSGIPSLLKIWQRRESSPAEQMEMTTPMDVGWACNPAPQKQNFYPFISLKNAECRSHRCLICMAQIIRVQSIK